MQKRSFHSLLFVLFSVLVTPLAAQEISNGEDDKNKGEFTMSGSLDSYFHKAFNTIETAPRTSFSNLPGFSLGMINLVGTYKGKKSGFVIDLVYGPRGSDAVFNAPLYKNISGGGSSQIINQMYAYYQVSEKIKLNVGQFNTFFSYEMISPTQNFHYSTSYLFSYGPFNHTGVWTDVDFGKGWTGKLAVMNPTDYTEYNPFDSYIIGGQLGFTKNTHSLYLNGSYGDPDGRLHDYDSVGSVSAGNTFQIDFIAKWNISEKYSVGLSSSYRAANGGEVRTVSSTDQLQLSNHGFCGMIVYQTLAISETFSIGMRAEYFDEFKGGVGALGAYNANGTASVVAVTWSAHLTSGNFKFIPEFRLDNTSQSTFTSKASSLPIARMVSSNFAFIYTLPTIMHKVN